MLKEQSFFLTAEEYAWQYLAESQNFGSTTQTVYSLLAFLHLNQCMAHVFIIAFPENHSLLASTESSV